MSLGRHYRQIALDTTVERRLREILAVVDAGRYPEADVRASIGRLLPEMPTGGARP